MQKYDIVLVDLNPVRGSEQSGIRPCIIIQNDYANAVARTFVVAIISTVIKHYPHMIVVDPSPENGLKEKSRIDCLQVRTVDQGRIIEKWGMLESKYQKSLDEAFCVAFGL